ncbi:MAG TPA: M20/M25/M40 family metallo-hydrolase [Bdellovibrionota bacterium]|jgi:glutamate carboxypeptidase|nr:M20/M25/M40 family metallo-hydrolase [Bdellovibrionota bacterium]
MTPELKGLLNSIFNLESQTSNVAGVGRVQNLVATYLSRMGFQLRYAYAEGKDATTSAPFLIAERGVSAGTKDAISFVSHADTVDGFEHRVDVDKSGKIAVGQGVLDDKACQVVALWGLHLFLQKHPQSQLPLRFLSSPNEEVGSTGFHRLYAELSRSSRLVLGFEPASEKGEIIISRRGNRWYRVIFRGREAHAGRAPHKGINAAYAAARAMVKLEALNDYARGVSVAVGSVSAAREAYNVVCGEVELRIDFRFEDFAARDRVDQKIRKILLSPVRGKSSPTGLVKVSLELVDDCPPMSSTEESRQLAKLYAKGVRSGKARAIASGGSADVCFMSRPGLTMLDGLGAVGGRMHSTEEWVDLDSVEIRAQALAEFLSKI